MTPSEVLKFAADRGAKILDLTLHGFPRPLAAFECAHQ